MLQAARKLKRLLDREQKTKLGGLFVLMILGAFLEVVSISLFVPVIMAILAPEAESAGGPLHFVRRILSGSGSRFVLYGILLLIGVFVIKTGFLLFEYRQQFRFIYRNRLTVQKKLLHAFFSRPYEYYLHAQTGETLRVMQGDVVRTFELMRMLLSFAADMIVSAALILTVFVISPVMTAFVSGILLVLILLIAKKLKPYQKKKGKQRNVLTAQMNKWLMQAVQGIREIRIGRKEAYFETGFLQDGEKAIRIDQAQDLLNSVPRVLIEAVSICAVLAVMAVRLAMGVSPEVLIPEVSAFAMAAVKILPCANKIALAINQTAYSSASLDKVLGMLESGTCGPEAGSVISGTEMESGTCGTETDPEGHFAAEEVKKGKKPCPGLHDSITFRQISYRYPGTDTDILREASFEIRRGESVGLIGPSGAGKTTVVDVLTGLLTPAGGQILIDGRDARTEYDGWLPHIGYIPQMVFMMDDTIRANVAFGFPDEERDEARIWEVLEEAQLADFVRSLPDGLETQIGERGVRLSGGQRQRIGIARALYDRPELLILDEATSALDLDTERAVMDSIYRLQGQRTVVIITHRPSAIARCDRIYEVRDGQIVERKPADEKE